MASMGIVPAVYRAAFDDAAAMPHATLSTLFDRRGALQFQNDAARAHFAAPNAGKRSINDLVRHFVDAAEGRRLFQDAVAGKSCTVEALVHTQAGPARHVIEISPAMRAGGVIAGIMMVEQPSPEASAAAAPAENPAHVFAQAGADWFWETDAALRITMMSNRPGLAPTSFGGDVMGALMFGPLPSIEGLDHAAIRAAVARREAFRELRFTRRHSSGKLHHFSVSGAPIVSPDGHFLGYRGIGRDRTAEVLAEERAATAQARLVDAIESIPESFALLDRNDRLVLCNSRFREQHAAAADWLVGGTRFDDIRRAAARAGVEIPAIDGAGETVEYRCGERWFKLSARRTEDGGLAIVQTDITALKQRESELAEKSSVLRATLESMNQGVLVIDRNSDVVTWNDRMLAIHNIPPSLMRVGLPGPEIVKFLAARGDYGTGDKGALAEQRLEEVSRLGAAAATQRVRPDGTIIEHRAARMPAGGVVHTFTDVTAWKRREREIEEQRKLLAGTLANMDQGMLVLDSSLSIRIWNPRLADLLALPPELLYVGMPVADLSRFMTARLGMKGEAIDTEVAKRVGELRAGDSRLLTDESLGGHVVERRSRAMPDGGYVVTYTDYTALAEREHAIEEKSTLLGATLANMEQGILVLDGDLNIRMWNDRIAALFNLQPNFFRVGQPMLELLRFLLRRSGRNEAEVEKLAVSRLATVMKRETLVLAGGDMKGRSIERRSRPMPNGGYVVTYTDVTERKQRDQEIAEKSALLAATLDNMDQGLIVVDDNDRAKLWNNRLIDMFKLPPDVMRMGRPFVEIVRYFLESAGTPPDQIEAKLVERMNELHGEVIPVIDRYRPDGRVIERRRRVMPLGGSVITYGDVTERKQREADLRRAKEEAEIASRSKTEFLANMSHELRTPLNAIIGFSDILVRQLFGPLGEARYAEYARDISESGQHLLSLINDVLDIAKVEFNKVELTEEPVDVREIVSASARLVTERANNGGVRLVVDVPENVPSLRADDRRLKQVLLNLLSNAVKFTPSGGTVTIRAEARADDFRFTVIDTGIGIAPADIEVAMRPFGQIDSSLSRRYEGTGLGLPLARSMVELHGGSLDITSEPGVGTTVTISLPAIRMIRDVIPPPEAA